MCLLMDIYNIVLKTALWNFQVEGINASSNPSYIINKQKLILTMFIQSSYMHRDCIACKCPLKNHTRTASVPSASVHRKILTKMAIVLY